MTTHARVFLLHNRELPVVGGLPEGPGIFNDMMPQGVASVTWGEDMIFLNVE